MLRVSGLLVIALGLAALDSAASTPAFAAAKTTVTPIEVQAGQLPLPARVPKVLPPYCASHNCLAPPRPGR